MTNRNHNSVSIVQRELVNSQGVQIGWMIEGVYTDSTQARRYVSRKRKNPGALKRRIVRHLLIAPEQKEAN